MRLPVVSASLGMLAVDFDALNFCQKKKQNFQQGRQIRYLKWYRKKGNLLKTSNFFTKMEHVKRHTMLEHKGGFHNRNIFDPLGLPSF